MDPAEIAACVVIFAAVGALFVGIALGLGRLLRPSRPTPLKQATYECGEVSIGPADLQFDLRFYVVALLFLVFEVELAFFFPWARVFGQLVQAARQEAAERGGPAQASSGVLFNPSAAKGGGSPRGAFLAGARNRAAASAPQENNLWKDRRLAQRFLWLAGSELAVFLAILLLGFFYIWSQGDLEWVRSLEPIPAEEPIWPEGSGAHAVPRSGRSIGLPPVRPQGI